MNIKSDKCPNCGAPIHIHMYGGFKCDYCGSQRIDDPFFYRKEDGITICHGRHKLSSSFLSYASPDAQKHIINDVKNALAHQLADMLLKYMIFAIDYDNERGDVDIEALIKIKPFEVELKEKYNESFSERFNNMCEFLSRQKGI